MEIEPTYVTFKQAKLLKEINYPQSEGYFQGYFVNIKTGRQISDLTKGAKWIKITAPEQWQVIEWLRVVHGIWVNVKCDCYGEFWYVELLVASKEIWNDLDRRCNIISAHREFLNEHDSPQEAYSAAFDYLLTNKNLLL
jgi:hypothetical protein